MALTGSSGCGKSSVGNFYLEKEAFTAGWGLNPVTKDIGSCKRTFGGKCVKIVDMPGFFDAYTLTTPGEFKELTKAVLVTPNGITALGYVIDVTSRKRQEDIVHLERLLSMKELLPYTFIIFTHAKRFGKTIEEQRKWIEDNIKTFPQALQRVLKSVDNRYLVLESIDSMEDPYYLEKKLHELSELLQELVIQNKTPFSPKYIDVAKCFQIFSMKQLEELVGPMAEDLQYITDRVKQYEVNLKDNDNSALWVAYLNIIGGLYSGYSYVTDNPVVTSISSVLGSVKSAVLNFINSNPEYSAKTAQVTQQKQTNSKS